MGDARFGLKGLLPLALLSLLLLGTFAPSAQAQLPIEVYGFDLVPVDGSRVDVPVNGQARIMLHWTDSSRDAYSTYLPPPVPPAPAANLQPHSVSFSIQNLVDDPGYYPVQPSGFVSYGGMQQDVEVIVQSYAGARHSNFPFNVTATISTQQNGTYTRTVSLVAHSLGPTSFAAQVGKSFLAKPNQVVDADVKLINLAIRPRAFDMEVTDNPCGMQVATTNNNLVKGKSEETYSVSFRTPAEKPWYFSELCTITLQVSPAGQPDVFQQVFIGVQVNGGYVDPVWVFQLVSLILLLLILFLILARRKARIEEEILGKPQKPWTIPVEVLYLKALKDKDQRAWYVVRHYLMEDEYRSALLWYKNYKRSTRGSRKKEGLVLRQEKSYERWKKQWHRAIARPLRQADRFEAALQRKLDRKARGILRKQMAKYRKVTGKMKAAHAKQVERAGKAHAKAVAKAAKKGLPTPKRPAVPEPDYPDEPQLVAIPLATHKWAKKAARFRAKKVRKQGDLEVKFEKADARRLRKVRRKVQRLARKLDDPTFVNEHPLLKGA